MGNFANFQSELNEEDFATFIIGNGLPVDTKTPMPKMNGMDNELWQRVLQLSTTKR